MALESHKPAGGSLNGAELEKALAEDHYKVEPAQLTGMVKASSYERHISIAPFDCASWVDIPSEMIAEAVLVGQQPCCEHSHPLFRIKLAEPSDPQARALWHLITAMSTGQMPTRSELERQARPGFRPGSVSEGRGQCTSWCSGSTLWCACPVYIPGFGRAYSVFPCGTCINDPVFTA